MRYLIPSLVLFCMLLGACGTARQDAASASSKEQETVGIGYGEITREQTTTSVARVKMDQAQSYTNMYDYLRGRVPGVQVVGTSIYIRGISSVNSNTEALILLDGVEVRDLSTVNPADVKSVDVLKDASASIYGNRGANGVVLITTK